MLCKNGKGKCQFLWYIYHYILSPFVAEAASEWSIEVTLGSWTIWLGSVGISKTMHTRGWWMVGKQAHIFHAACTDGPHNAWPSDDKCLLLVQFLQQDILKCLLQGACMSCMRWITAVNCRCRRGTAGKGICLIWLSLNPAYRKTHNVTQCYFDTGVTRS